ncbi:hypothetical protein NV379_14750 [Paenibacillus sp. N1-5-1-14]|uniref:hypothetical protein n=1 Tax=Paenibacillus radicibacter TaxID=2972488 RepID=UPI0021599EE8|nr:hypothetical protein [Paenibacillus radicibacter]MCR8643912.1 hypothetical protein [Paenibacillus radicibacter]
MAGFILRPDLRTAGGEVSDIVWEDQFVGTLSLVYRESDRISGALQLEEGSLSDEDKEEVLEHVEEYVQGLIDALGVDACDVIVTHSSYERVISTSDEQEIEMYEVEEDDEEEFLEFDRPCSFFELVQIAISHGAAEYEIHNEDGQVMADVFCEIQGQAVYGTVDWVFDPMEDEIEGAADLIAAEFEETAIDSFVLDMVYDGEIVDTVELLHEALLDYSEQDILDAELEHNEYHIEMVRDDDDSVTYEIYNMSYGAMPIGSATVDLSRQQITGFIDFRSTNEVDDRVQIAKLLMDEVDKERDCDHINVTMLCNNEVIDELFLETEPIH